MNSSFAAPYASEVIRWLAASPQPARRDFGLSAAAYGDRVVEIRQRDIVEWPFCILTEFSAGLSSGHRILLVAPLSGHFAFILREMVLGLVEGADVSVTDWLNASHVPLSAGDFGFDDNVETIVESLKLIGPGAHVIALCQGVMPALAATAVMSRSDPDFAPRSLTLMGGPVDPLANPTRVVRLLFQRGLRWIEANALDTVGPSQPGDGRFVYPAYRQFSALMAYLYRHLTTGGELLRKISDDDGIDPIRFPFLDLFISLMDLPAKYFLENIQKVFLDREAWTGELTFRGEPVDFTSIRNTALMTIEGANDDIAAPGQTSAAHRLCPNVPDGMRLDLVMPGAGHFSLFHGAMWREALLPEVKAFVGRASVSGVLRSDNPLMNFSPLTFIKA
jgi:poly(3-hydroxybutyrate) depolymerase